MRSCEKNFLADVCGSGGNDSAGGDRREGDAGAISESCPLEKDVFCVASSALDKRPMRPIGPSGGSRRPDVPETGKSSGASAKRDSSVRGIGSWESFELVVTFDRCMTIVT